MWDQIQAPIKMMPMTQQEQRTQLPSKPSTETSTSTKQWVILKLTSNVALSVHIAQAGITCIQPT